MELRNQPLGVIIIIISCCLYIFAAPGSAYGSCVVYEPLDRYVDRHLDRYIG